MNHIILKSLLIANQNIASLCQKLLISIFNIYCLRSDDCKFIFQTFLIGKLFFSGSFPCPALNFSLTQSLDETKGFCTAQTEVKFPLRICSVNMTKSAGNCGFGNIYRKKSIMENFIFCKVPIIKIIAQIQDFQ